MKKPSLVWKEALSLAVIVLLAAAPLRLAAQVPNTNSIGQIIPLGGHIDEVVIDEARGLVYASNFSAGMVEVVSMATKRVTARYGSAPKDMATSGLAISPNKKWLVATNYKGPESGVPQFRGLYRINLNDPTDRLSIAMADAPLGIAFGSDNIALIMTTAGIELFNPETGEFRRILALGATCPGCLDLPVDVTIHLPNEVVRASVAASLDGRWIFGQTDAFLFSYQVRPPVGTLIVRPNAGLNELTGDLVTGYGALVRPPAFEVISGSPDGTSFMAGHLLFNRQLHVVADTPTIPEASTNDEFIGGNGFDPDPTSNTVYFAFKIPDGEPGAGPDHPILNILHVMDADNLHVRQELRTAEQITGRIVVTSNGNDLYAVSESGLLYIPLNRLNEYPVLEVSPATRYLSFNINACERGEGVTQTIRIENPAGGPPAQFSLSAPLSNSGNRPAIRFQPSTGTTPADVKVTIDVGALGPVQGATTIPIQISTDAVNIPQPAIVVANLAAADQRGELVQTPGRFMEVVGDPFRDRYYGIDQDNFEVVVFDSSDNRIIGRLRTGNTPIQAAVSRTGDRLFVTNSFSEGLTVVDLNQLVVEGIEFLPWQTVGEGHYPYSVTVDNGNRLLIGVRSAGSNPQCGGPGRVDLMHAASLAVSSPDTFGVVVNCYGAIPALQATPDGSKVVFAESDGYMQVWSSTDDEIIFSRQQFAENGLGLQGTVGAGPDYYIIENHVMNSSLVPRGQFPDSPPNAVSSGFTVTPDGVGVRAVRPVSQVDTGAINRIDPRDPTAYISPIRLTSQPVSPSARMLELEFPFTRSLSSLRDGRLVSTSSAGIVAIPKEFDAGFALPVISAVTNAADYTTKIGSGGLVSIFGRNLAPGTAGAVDTPLPRNLANVCVMANGEPLPLLYVSPGQINAQLPFSAVGPSDTVVHASNGISDVYVTQVDPTAPAIFKVTGPDSSQFAAIFRSENLKLATLSNPLRPNEVAIIYATGLGQVSPIAVSGVAASTAPLQTVPANPVVEFGGVAGDVKFAGLAPGFVGLYQINVQVPGTAPLGLQVPLTITMGANTTTVSVRIVD